MGVVFSPWFPRIIAGGGEKDSAPAFFGGARRVCLWTLNDFVAQFLFQNKMRDRGALAAKEEGENLS